MAWANAAERAKTVDARHAANWSNDRAEHPRKQFVRAGWISLDGDWSFAYDDEGRFQRPEDVREWNRTIRVPFPPESKMSGIGDEGFHPRCWYKRTFRLSRPEGRRVFLRFGAVDYRASVWLNGRFLGWHEGGHSPFSFEITLDLARDRSADYPAEHAADHPADHSAAKSDQADQTADQTIVVLAEDDPHDLAKPRGKQDWQERPHSIWYPRTTGVWQSVWLEQTPMTYVDCVRWEPRLERWELGVEAFLGGDPAPGAQLRVRLACGDQLLANDSYQAISGEVHRRIALSDPGVDDFRNQLLWSPEKPTLLDAVLELSIDGRVVDRVESYAALRSVSISRDRFMLNGRPYYLRLALDQGYWLESLMAPPSSQALRRDVEIAKEAGFNGVRKHQKIEHPDYLYWADRLGLLVWEEMPSAYRFTQESVRRLAREWMEVIERDFNHPCVVVWVPFNESWGVPDLEAKTAHQSWVQALYHLTRTLDPTRPCIGNDGWESVATDILGIHDYDNDPDRLRARYGAAANLPEFLRRGRPGGRVLTLEGHDHRGQPVMLTEFGGIALADRRGRTDSSSIWGYAVGESPDDLERRYGELLRAVQGVDLFSGFCYTQLTDTFQEANGLFYADRVPKFDVRRMADLTVGRRRGPDAHRDGEGST